MNNNYIIIGIIGLVVLYFATRSTATPIAPIAVNTSGLATQQETQAQLAQDAITNSINQANANSQIAIINANTQAQVNTINTQSSLNTLQSQYDFLYGPLATQAGHTRGTNGLPSSQYGNTWADVLNYFQNVLPAQTSLNLQNQQQQQQLNYQQQQQNNQANCHGNFLSQATCYVGRIGTTVASVGSLFGLKL